MKTFTTVAALQDAVAAAKKDNKTIGLVPTMGALHEGHLSLIHKAKSMCDVVVVSVFVNPIQFNNKEDLEKYPRTVDADLEKLESANTDMVLLPSVEEMYPKDFVAREWHFGPIEEVMEGPQRPGHFAGVATVVCRLFEIVMPNKAFFGEKDFQQIAIIKEMLRQVQYPIEIVPCPIVRAENGLAKSSRNMRLSAEALEFAPNIYATLRKAVEMSKEKSVAEVKQWVVDTLSMMDSGKADMKFEPEYFEIVNDTTLQPVENWNGGVVGCITVWLTGVRLIDMIRFR